MGKRNTSLTVALSVSLIAHGLGLSGLAWWYIEHNLLLKTPPIDRVQALVDRMLSQMPPQPKTPPPAPKTAPPAEPQKKSLPRPEPHKLQNPFDHKDDSGETNGTGTANRSTDGEQPMQAESGYEQADLMKQAQNFSDNAFLPASAGKQQTNNVDQQKSPKAGTYVPDFALDALASKDSPVKPLVVPVTDKGIGPMPKIDKPKITSPAISGTKDPIANVPTAQAPTPKPEQREVRGHRATLSDTESIALAKINSGIFKAGRLVGRKGLKVKTTLPRFGDASYADIQMLGGVRTVVQARVDADGNVQDVQVVQTSGSQNVDQDCKTAVWNWTLEPEKDKTGRPVDYTWTIAFE
jgi:TonB family protein